MVKRSLVAALAVLLAAAAAQPQAPDPELRARIEPYLELTRTVALVLQLERDSGLPLTPAQAEQLIPLLIELDSSPGYSVERAVELRDAIELEVLTGEQLIWIDGTFLAQQEAAAAGGGTAPFGRFGGGGPGTAGNGGFAGPGGGQRQNGAGGAGGPGGGNRGLFQQLANGEPVNLLAGDQGAGALLDELITLVQPKLE
jgi:hypothetical protein